MKTTLKRGAIRGDTNGAGPPVFPPSPLTAVSRYGPQRPSRLRRLGKYVAWALVVVLVLAGGVTGGLLLRLEHFTGALEARSPEVRAAQAILNNAPPPDQPATAVVIGYDKRPGQSGRESRSDTVLLVRADPNVKTVTMLSFPRDLVVELAGCRGHPPRVARINEAFTDCGPKGTLETVRDLTGIPINYIVTVDFRGFRDIVNELGGVYLDVDRRYFNDNSGLAPGQRYDAIDLHPGYQLLAGGPALDFVRYRHTDSDLYRNARQQQFVRAMKQQTSGLSGLSNLPGILNAIEHNVEIGVGGGGKLRRTTLLSYARLAYELPGGNFQQVRIEGLTENGFFELSAPESAIDAAVDEFMNPDPHAGEKAASAVAGKGKPSSRFGPSPSQVTVEVLNGNGVVGSADEATAALSSRGYRTVNGGNADRADYFTTRILYDAERRQAKAAADDMVKLFGDARAEAAPSGELETMLRVVVGQTFRGTLGPAPKDKTPRRRPPAVVRDSSSIAPLLRRAQRKVDFPVLVPTLRDRTSELAEKEPVRVYRLGGADAVRIVFNGPEELDYWGIQQTGWTDAPMLEGPSVTRRIGGREYRLFFNGPRLHVVAFEEKGAAYWVANTLLDKLSNETMLEIAKGLRPVRR